MLYNRSLLFSHFIYTSIYLLIPNSKLSLPAQFFFFYQSIVDLQCFINFFYIAECLSYIFFLFFSIIICYRILNIGLCTIHSRTLFIQPVYISLSLLTPSFPIFPPLPAPLTTTKISHFKVNNSVHFCAFIMLNNLHFCLVPKHFISKGNSTLIKQFSPFSALSTLCNNHSGFDFSGFTNSDTSY